VKPTLAGVALLTLFAGGLRAEGNNLPKFPPPPLGLATARERDDDIQLRVTILELAPAPQKGKKTGKSARDPFPGFKVGRDVTAVLNGKTVQVVGTDGKKIKRKAILRLLRKKTPVLVSTFGKVDPVYLRFFKPGILIVVLPPQKVYPPIKQEKGKGSDDKEE
jgi:hypothetical protein